MPVCSSTGIILREPIKKIPSSCVFALSDASFASDFEELNPIETGISTSSLPYHLRYFKVIFLIKPFKTG